MELHEHQLDYVKGDLAFAKESLEFWTAQLAFCERSELMTRAAKERAAKAVADWRQYIIDQGAVIERLERELAEASR